MWRSFWETWRRSAPSSRCWSNLWRSAPSRSLPSHTASLQQHSHSFTVRPGPSSGGRPVLQGCWLKPLRREEIHCSVVLHKHMSVVSFLQASGEPTKGGGLLPQPHAPDEGSVHWLLLQPPVCSQCAHPAWVCSRKQHHILRSI